ncbi:mannitol dehydrogenase family protein [Weissella coleopterorum]|uniref:Mannitol dehydrogenase family protein n=1 Tax=Weissella coleopterorum TaxID=2714949 RepID=A0A6G8B1J0_9LACO|nr:mannitol dehydrogenase family protein [Weissella coleopterorum]QIL51178.1 mannitol dehydrogenase family protein [Weissella coleopterorum]
MVKVIDDYKNNQSAFDQAGIVIPQYDQNKIIENARNNPVWVHFGGGNLFRSFHAKIAQDLINQGLMNSGVIVAETYDDEVIEKMYQPYDNRFLSVVMKSDDSFDKELIGSVADSIYFNHSNPTGWQALTEVFKQDSLQFVTLSITEKGYSITDIDGTLNKMAQADITNGPDEATTNIGAITHLLFERFNHGAKPIAMISTDNFSENGKKLEDSVRIIANGWVANGKVEPEFLDYLFESGKVSFPWSMIDRITPNPSEVVAQKLKENGFEDTEILHTSKHTNIAPFGNTEEVHYLVIEDDFPNGRPDLTQAGVILTNRETVNNVDQMKVTALLNPLHTALAIYGSLLKIDTIAEAINNPLLLNLVKRLGYDEDLPVVVDPEVIDPKTFIDQLIQKRLPNKNVPDRPQRIATDTSQKMAVRYGVTINSYLDSDKLDINNLEAIPLIIAGWLRYLLAIDDLGQPLELSPDPLKDELQSMLTDIKFGAIDPEVVHQSLNQILANKAVFGLDLTETPLANKIEAYFKQLIESEGSIENTLKAF